MHAEQTCNLVRGASVLVSGDPARVGAPGQLVTATEEKETSKGEAEPRIEIIRQGDVIQAIDVICTCGQHIRLHCHYAENAGN